MDEKDWEVDQDGNPRDPWQFTNYIPFMSETGELFTFATGSKSGLNAIGDLLRGYLASKRKYPNDHLKVAIGVGSFKTKKYGRIKHPEFTIIGHTPKAEFNEALTNAGVFVPDADVPSAEPVKQLKDELNDEIPTFGGSPSRGTSRTSNSPTSPWAKNA
jgi:hypothetical protein